MVQSELLLLTYSGCSTCRRAQQWLSDHGIPHTLRPIVDQPPRISELARWISASGVEVRKWLNTSGQSYRALGKAKFDAATDEEITLWLSEDGKLVKRPVAVLGDRVIVGFKAEVYAAVFGS